MLSSRNKEDTKVIHRGLQYTLKHGLIIAVLARDVADAIPNFILNIQTLEQFFQHVQVVLFENDSKDGTREIFQNLKDLNVDVIECSNTPKCQFHRVHRYEGIVNSSASNNETINYFQTSAIGQMHIYRQQLMDYILKKYRRGFYTYVMIYDIDINVSISPLGIIHSFGLLSDVSSNKVAKVISSASRQVWPGSFGTLIPPYDFAPFRATFSNSNLEDKFLYLTEKFCNIRPVGDRWRNQCESISPLHFLLILAHDKAYSDSYYHVSSAFNGAAIYPLDLIQSTNASYDAGEDGQRCEHVGFNYYFKDSIIINSKWRMNLSPSNPGGPEGTIALKNIERIIVQTPLITVLLVGQTFLCMWIVIYFGMMMGFLVFIPLLRRRILTKRYFCSGNGKEWKYDKI